MLGGDGVSPWVVSLASARCFASSFHDFVDVINNEIRERHGYDSSEREFSENMFRRWSLILINKYVQLNFKGTNKINKTGENCVCE